MKPAPPVTRNVRTGCSPTYLRILRDVHLTDNPRVWSVFCPGSQPRGRFVRFPAIPGTQLEGELAISVRLWGSFRLYRRRRGVEGRIPKEALKKVAELGLTSVRRDIPFITEDRNAEAFDALGASERMSH
jgi:hypothetical protein